MVEFWRSWSLPTPAPTRGNHYSLARLNLFVGAVRLARFRRRPERLIRQNSGPQGGLSHQTMKKVEVGVLEEPDRNSWQCGRSRVQTGRHIDTRNNLLLTS